MTSKQWPLCVAVCWCDWQGGNEAWYCNAAGSINVCVLHSAVCVAGKSRPQQSPVPWCCKYMYEVYRYLVVNVAASSQ